MAQGVFADGDEDEDEEEEEEDFPFSDQELADAAIATGVSEIEIRVANEIAIELHRLYWEMYGPKPS